MEPEVTIDDLMKPDTWSHVANMMKPGDHVEVHWDDGKYFAQLLVIDATRTYAHMKVREFLDLREGKENENDMLDGYAYKWRGPHHRHCIVRVKDGAVMTSEQATKEDALKWLIQNKTRLVA